VGHCLIPALSRIRKETQASLGFETLYKNNINSQIKKQGKEGRRGGREEEREERERST
jgi:hypothetical protein